MHKEFENRKLYKTYLVGGIVRDALVILVHMLLGKEGKEFDHVHKDVLLKGGLDFNSIIEIISNTEQRCDMSVKEDVDLNEMIGRFLKEKGLSFEYILNNLLPKDGKDFDYVIEPKENVSLEEIHGHLISRGFSKVGKDFPVYKKDDLDVAFTREEKKKGTGYYGFEVVAGVGVKIDLLRRDFLINSVAYDLEEGRFVEPEEKNALRDIVERKIRPTSMAFLEDPLRFVRLARMSSKFPDFEVVYEDFRPMLTEGVKKEISEIPRERIVAEIMKTLKTPKPSNFFKVLKELDILDIIMPDIARMVGKEQSLKHHAEGDVFDHTMYALDEVSKVTRDPKVRFGVLMHDVGKAYTYEQAIYEERDMSEKYFGHEDGFLVQTILENYVEEYKFSTEYVEFAYRAAAMHHFLHKIEILGEGKLAEILLNKEKGYTEGKIFEKRQTVINLVNRVRGVEVEQLSQKKVLSKKRLPLVVGREDIKDLVTATRAGDSYGRIAQTLKNGESEFVSLEDAEIVEVFKKGVLEKGDSTFVKGELTKPVDYEMFLDLYDYVQKNKERYSVSELMKSGYFKDEDGKLDVAKKEKYIYDRVLGVVKSFKKEYDEKRNVAVSLNNPRK